MHEIGSPGVTACPRAASPASRRRPHLVTVRHCRRPAQVRKEEPLANELDRPHDKLFRAVFSDTAEAVGLLRTALPAELRESMDWQSLKLLDGTFLDDALRESESDLLYEVMHGGSGQRLWLYLLLDQTRLGPGEVEGDLKGQIAQLLMMAAFGRHGRLAVEMAAQLLTRLRPGGGVNYLRMFVRYVLATHDSAGTAAFGEALRRHEREQGGEMISYAQQLLEEGEKLGQVKTIERMLRIGMTWDVIEAATGLNESAFQTLKEGRSASARPALLDVVDPPAK